MCARVHVYDQYTSVTCHGDWTHNSTRVDCHTVTPRYVRGSQTRTGPVPACSSSSRDFANFWGQKNAGWRDPIAFVPLTVDTTARLHDDFIRLFFLHSHREVSALENELTEESDQFRFLRAACLANLKGSVGLIMEKSSVMRISIPLELSYRSFIPLPCFIRSRRPTPLLAPSLVLFPPCSA